jgi:hypothetical protein
LTNTTPSSNFISLAQDLGHRVTKAIILLSIFIVGTTLFPAGASAQQPTDVTDQVRIGPYDITVVGGPSLLSLGTALYSVTLLSAEDGQPVSNAQVRLRTRHELAGTQGWAEALNTPGAPELYRVQLQLDRTGPWALSVEVNGPLGRVEAELTTLVIPESRGYGVGSLTFAGVTVVILLGLTYLVLSARRAQRQRANNAD